MHNIYHTTKLDVIMQCELGREAGGQTSLPDTNLVLVSVNDINSFMTILIIIIFSFENNQINTYRYMHNIYYTTILDVIIQCELGRGARRTNLTPR